MGRKKKNLDDVTAIVSKSLETKKSVLVEPIVEIAKDEPKSETVNHEPTAKDRVKNELAELIERNQKLGNLLGKVKSSDVTLLNKLSNEQKKLLSKQYMMQNRLIHILKRRLEIWSD